MSKVEETIGLLEGLIPRGIISPKLKSDLIDYLREIEAEQEELQKKADKYDELMRLAVATNTPVDAIKPFDAKNIKLADYKPLSMTEKLDKLLNELDDPEKFDQFIDDYHAFVDKDKPVEVPEFVADWFEKNKKNLDYKIWEYIYDFDVHNQDDFCKWMNSSNNNPIEILIRMQDGYTVKQEQLYYVILPNIDYGNGEYQTYLRKSENGEVVTDPICEEWKNDIDDSHRFTESEIKAIDERYWPFAVKVEE